MLQWGIGDRTGTFLLANKVMTEIVVGLNKSNRNDHDGNTIHDSSSGNITNFHNMLSVSANDFDKSKSSEENSLIFNYQFSPETISIIDTSEVSRI